MSVTPIIGAGRGPRPRWRRALAWAACALLLAGTAGTAAAAEHKPSPPAPAVAPAFDHLTTGFELLGQHRDLPCEACHANAVFKGTPRECSACHGVGTAVRATAKPKNHILSSDRCDACHNTVAWSPAVSFDHVEVRGSCSTCHNNVQAQGEPPSHIQTDLECNVCHSTISWAGALFNHSGVTGNCASCHNGVQATGLPSNHIPTTGAACESCHNPADFTDWLGATMNHAVVTSEPCESCHEAGMGSSFIGVTIVTRPPAPHPTSGDCGACHTTTSFNNGITLPANHIPLPGGDTCTLCHTNPGDYTVYTMSHANIANNCAQCHAAGLSFANMAPPVLKQPPSNHIPFGSVACESCHASTTFTSFSMTDASSAAPPGMVHSAVSSTPCSTCHEAGLSFAGMPPVVTRPASVNGQPHVLTGECSTCHFSTTSFLGASNFPANHIPVPAADGSNCALCHSNAADYSIYVMSHANIAGNCAQCHAAGLSFTNMAAPTLKQPPGNHVPIGSAPCEACHSASTFTSFAMTNASGSAPPAMVHSAVAGMACSSCHAAGLSFVGTPATRTLPGNHVPIGSAPCESCHQASNTTSFAMTNASGSAPPAMVHSAVAGVACAICHASGLSFVGTPATKAPPGNHIPIGTAPCESCHQASNTTSFAFSNASTTAPPGMVHSVVSSTPCSTCHEAGKSFAGTPVVVTRPASVNGQPHVQTGECSTCHFSTTTFLGASNYPANHIPVPAADNNNCALCHSNANDYSVYTMSHANIAGNCAQCHAAGLSFTNMAAPTLKQPPSNHVPIGSAPCESCHSATVFTSFAMTNASATTAPGMVHSAVSGTACATCHASGLSFVGTPATRTLPGNHVPVGSVDCGSCHSPTTFTSFAMTNASTTTPPGMVHSVVSGVACATCHASGLSFVGTPATKAPPGNHIPIGTAPCESCHQASNTTSFAFSNASATAPPGMVHSAVSSTPCSTCHEAGKSFVGTPAVVTRPASVNGTPHVQTGECSNCHFSTTTFLGAANLPSNHIPLPSADNSNCALCHTNAADYSVYTMNHVNITNNCAQCHAYGLSFANMAPPTLVQPPAGSTGHIPSNPPNGTGSYACELCHSATVFSTFSGTVMKHAVVTGMKCMSCHEYGMQWKTNSGVRLWVRDSPSHHAGQDCGGSGCHTARDKLAIGRPGAASAIAIRPQVQALGGPGSGAGGGASGMGGNGLALGAPVGFNHARIGNASCASCHNGVKATGKPAAHIATTSDCGSCHTTLSWTRVTQVDHLQVLGSCASCHNGIRASAKPVTHVATTADCGVCHTSNSWIPARLEHSAVNTSNCRSCHDGVHAIGVPANHVPVTQDCGACHGTLAWTPAKVDHSTLTARCASCHNGLAATGLPLGHFVTRIDCAACHVYPSWTPVVYRHTSAAYPGDHRAALTCVSCHAGNSEQVVYAAPANAPACGACHAKDFKPQAHPKTVKGLLYSATELRDCTGACHVYSDSGAGIVRSLPGPYHRVTDAAFRH